MGKPTNDHQLTPFYIAFLGFFCPVRHNKCTRKTGPVFTKNLKAKSSSLQGNLGATSKNNGRVSHNFRTPNF